MILHFFIEIVARFESANKNNLTGAYEIQRIEALRWFRNGWDLCYLEFQISSASLSCYDIMK